MKIKVFSIGLVALFLTVFLVPEAYANVPLILRGLGKTLFSVFEIPRTIIGQSTAGLFPLSLVTGTVMGSVRMVMGTLGGAFDLVQGAAPFAKYALFLV